MTPTQPTALEGVKLLEWLAQKKRDLFATPDFRNDVHLRGEYFAYTRVEDYIRSAIQGAKGG